MRQLIPVILLASLPAWAQQGNLQPLPAVPPPAPGMEAFDAALEPQVTIVKTETETREEFRQNGRIYMVKVTPAVGPVYYLVDQQGDGNFVQQDSPGTMVSPAMWRIFSW
ncbi:MAG: DUF2782 domain-containing protein [Dechloromonas sp.]|mgnify:FL=1|jgi:hypothetical protein|nr:MAG: DUF2782 domain-containing protein [Dechloromonas sp.]